MLCFRDRLQQLVVVCLEVLRTRLLDLADHPGLVFAVDEAVVEDPDHFVHPEGLHVGDLLDGLGRREQQTLCIIIIIVLLYN